MSMNFLFGHKVQKQENVQYVPFLLLPIQAWITQKVLNGFSSFLSQMKDYRSSNLLRKFQINRTSSFFHNLSLKKMTFWKVR